VPFPVIERDEVDTLRPVPSEPRYLSTGDLRVRWDVSRMGVWKRLHRAGMLTEERRSTAGFTFTVAEIEFLEAAHPEWRVFPGGTQT
jgi:hypothetical protein